MTPTWIEPEMVAVDCAKAVPAAANVARAATLLTIFENKELL